MIPQLEIIKTKGGTLELAKRNPVILNILPLRAKKFLDIQI